MTKKTITLEVSQFKKRVRRSFSIGALAGVLFIASWTLARHSPDAEGIPSFFRSVLGWNAALWSTLSSGTHLATRPSMPPRGTRPRFNGNLGLKSPMDVSRWQLEVMGSHSLKLSLLELKLLPHTDSQTEFYCIEGWRDRFSYQGIRFSDFLEHYHLGRHADGSYYAYVALETPDRDYYVSIDMKSMLHPQTLLAWEMNGAPLSVENGAPLRLIIPIKYGIKSLKRIGRIYFSDERPRDYWAEQGYDWYSGL